MYTCACWQIPNGQEIMSQDKMKVGIVGCGNISDAYFNGCRAFPILEVVACADLDLSRAKAKAEQHAVSRAYEVSALLADPEIDIVINLTVPKAHAEIAVGALESGKSVYNEKPLALQREEGQHMLRLAEDRGLRVGCAPDTFLGGGLQTSRKLIDDGWIGEPVAATAFMIGHGSEGWHPDPEFFYQPGAGPMFDMGPYYLTALVSLLGPMRRIAGSVRISFPERTITSQPKFGTKFKVTTPSHVTGVVDFHSGPIATLIMTFDVWASQLPRIEIYGSEGTLSVPDPNGLGGPVRVKRPGMDDWVEIPLIHNFTQPNRGIGVADMAHAIRSGRKHRASGQLANHMLDAMHSFLDSSREGRHIELQTTCDRPEPLALGNVQEALLR